LLREGSEIRNEIFSLKQEKGKSVCLYTLKLKAPIRKMKTEVANKLLKRWSMEGLLPNYKNITKAMPPMTYDEALTRVLNLESEDRGKAFVVESEEHVISLTRSQIERKGESTSLPTAINMLKNGMEKIMKEISHLKKDRRDIWCTRCRRDRQVEFKCTEEIFIIYVL
jgi:hypothetical protein